MLWKQACRHSLTPAEIAYQETPRELDVFGEVFNGIKYAAIGVLGQNLYGSVASAVTEGLWTHVPAIVSYYGAILFGSKGVGYAVEQLLQRTELTEEQKKFLEPWLNLVGRLALGFIPKVHASGEAVHYHYPSLQGSSKTISRTQTITLQGNKLFIERDGLLNTPEGAFEGIGTLEFKLHQIYEISEERVLIQVVNRNQELVPVEFIRIHGEYGPEIFVKSPDKQLEQHWAAYFKPPKAETPTKPFAMPGQVVTELQGSSLACPLGLTLGVLGSLATQNPLPILTSTLSCLPSAEARPQHISNKMLRLAQNHNYLALIHECEAIEEANRTPEVYYYLGLGYKNLGSFTQAHQYFKLVVRDKKYATNQELVATNRFIENIQNQIYVHGIRSQFLKEVKMTAPTHYEYITMSVLAYEPKEVLSTHSEMQQLSLLGWTIGRTSDELDIVENGYHGTSFIHEENKNIIISHRGAFQANVGNLIKALSCISKNEKPPQYQQAELFTQKLQDNYPGFNISHTGHNIGATLAEVLAFNRTEMSVTLESPGSQELVLNQFNQEEVENTHAVTYQSFPNFFNTFKTQLGEVRTIAPTQKTVPEKLIDIMAAVYKQWGTYDSTFLTSAFDITQTLSGDLASHYPKNLHDNFHYHTGFTTDYKLVKRWPHQITELKTYKDLCDTHEMKYENPITADPSVRFRLDKVYSTLSLGQETISLDRSRMKLSLLPLSIRNVLELFYKTGEYFDNFSPRILMLYKIQGDELILKSDVQIFNSEDLINYTRYKLVEADKLKPDLIVHPFYQCCLEPAKAEENPESSLNYAIFFNLEVIKNHPKEAIYTLKEFIKEQNGNEFKRYFQILGGNKLEKSINKELKEKDIRINGFRKSIMNYITLFNSFFNTKMVVHLNFSKIRNNPSEFFKGKTLLLRDSRHVEVIHGEIASVTQTCSTFDVELVDKSRVSLQMYSGCQVETAVVEKKWSQSLHSFVELDYLETSEIKQLFELIVHRDKLGSLYDLNPEGNYFILKLESYDAQRIIQLAKDGNNYPAYEIEIIYNLVDEKKKEVELVTFKNIEKKVNQELLFNDFIKAFEIRYFEKKSILIDPDSVDQNILIWESGKNQKVEKMNQLLKIQQELIYALIQDENLDDLLRDIKANKYEILKNKKYSEKHQNNLNKINKLYVLMDEPQNMERVLINAALEANYRRIVNRPDALSVSEVMALFTKAHQFINELEGKDIILFLGETG